jgi:uncharacterized Zn finger protein
LSDYLKERAAEQEDWPALIALETLTATNERDYRSLATLCLRNTDPTAAARWLRKADRLDGGDNIASATCWAKVYAAGQDWEAATLAQERAFQYEPEYSRYNRLIELAAYAGHAEETRHNAHRMLREEVAASWQNAQRAYTLAQILRDEQDWEGVYSALVGRVDDPDRLCTAARWLTKYSPERASKLYALAIQALVAGKKKTSYQKAVKTLAEARPCFESVGPQAFSGFVRQLRETHRLKRSFLAMLDSATAL